MQRVYPLPGGVAGTKVMKMIERGGCRIGLLNDEECDATEET